jgi:hypothetical protein
MYKNGEFVVEPAKQFEAEVAEIFYPVTDKITMPEDEEIVKMLKQGNRVGIKKLLEENPACRDNIVILTRENIGEIPSSMVKDLSTMFQVELEIEDE